MDNEGYQFNPITNVPVEPEAGARPFTQAELDVFLDLWLEAGDNGAPRYSPERIVILTGRSKTSLHPLPWKLATAYIQYTPLKRLSRAGLTWSPRDAQMLYDARHGQGAAERGVDTAYIAAVLGRTIADVLRHEEEVKLRKGTGFGYVGKARA